MHARKTWLATLANRFGLTRTRTRPVAKPRRATLRVEGLEDRAVPAVIIDDPFDNGVLGTNPNGVGSAL